MKKIKNPEKYIQKLKRTIRRLEVDARHERRYRQKYDGTCIIRWSSNVETEETCTSQGLGAFRVDDYVAVVGQVLEVHEEVGESKIRFRRIQTKKVEAI